MAIRADLHLHSSYSLDGEKKVDDILRLCSENGIETLSITDHNLVKATGEALKSAAKYSIRVIPGIEVDCCYKSIDLHLLGYQIQWNSADFTALEKEMGEKIMASLARMVENLGKLGIHVDPEEVIRKAEGKLPSAELIAEVLLSNSRYDHIKALDAYRPGGRRSDMPFINFYIDYFAQGKPAYVGIKFMEFSDAVALIRRNGGIPVVAHPGHNLRGREEIAVELLQQGAAGLEVFNNYHDKKQMDYFAEIALKHQALMTCGSDFHGKTKPLIYPGNFRSVERYEGYVMESVEELLC